ncbi:SusC/RagA family TonB-linked outer membrane protein [Chitinophaga barathri]|uniref:SusC/RagA family TonB-linked outer membrane protein n=1 Tax=Chitinophaga barathri TaxID=1647451 RepID=A0A3N4M9S0_9BACT|nr:SusC/RagA family TonB-linked outer membrane protein [Chitinophaga barathri]RPD38087.1 SusC/RagA family TonB-linked outer membrane protein [Chitinophaga barathri]
MFKRTLQLMFLLLLSLHGAAQEQKVTGTVKDKTGSALPGVTIADKGVKNSGTVTDANGNFSLTVKGTARTLIFSIIGYNNQEVDVAGKTSINVVMEVNTKTLGDVVVIGYQEVSRRKNTASIATVKGETIANLPAPSVDMMLQGRVSGVNVQNFSGEPGIRNTIVVRGNSSVLRGYDEARALSAPLYVIDGVPTSATEFGGIDASGTGTNAIAGINPNDIESLDILKDASAAAIYGSRGSNGIIIIKTKRAKKGKPEFNFSTYMGISKKPQLTEVVAGAEERRMKMAVMDLYNGPIDDETLPMMLTDSLNPDFNNATDWQSYFYQNGMINNYDLSMSGANDVINYRISVGHYKEDGIVKNTGFKRYTIMGTIGSQLAPWLNNQTRFRVTRTDRPRSINERTGSFFAFDSYSLPSSFYKLTDNTREYLLGNDSRQDKNINNNVLFTTAFNANVAKGLNFNVTANYENRASNRDYYQPSVVRDNKQGYAYFYSDKTEIASLYTTLEYSKAFGAHHLNLIGGQNLEYTKWVWNSGDADLIPNDYAWAVNVSNKLFSNTSSSIQETGLQSLFARVNYDFKDRYLLSASFTGDASSKFGADNRWGAFPSVSAGWIVSDEPFFQDLNWLSFLKIRGSYGITGNQPEKNYLGYNNYNVNRAGFGDNNDVTSYNGTSVITPNYRDGIAQKDLSWEESKQGNIGFEAGFFKDRIHVVVDAYKRETTKGFFSYLLPNASGYTEAQTNAIGTRNAGLEVTINTRNLNPKSELQWYTDLTFSYNQNMITALPNGGRSIVFNYNTGVYGSDYLLSVGLPANQFYVFEYKGIYSRQEDIPFNLLTGQPLKNFVGWDYYAGDPILVDQDGNFDLKEPMDQIVGGDPNPKFYGGVLNNLTWKGFTFGVFLNYTFGRDILNSYNNRRFEYLFEATGDEGERNLAKRAIMDIDKLNYWKKPGDKADLPTFSLVNGQRSPYRFLDKSTMYIENGDYLRIKTITFGYNFNEHMLRNLKIKRLRLYGVIDNIYTFQHSNVPDAEAVNAYGVYDGDGYPIPKKFTFGLDFGF